MDENKIVENAIVWVAYCTTCREIIDAGKNGDMVSAMGTRHKNYQMDNFKEEHKVLIGYYL